MFVKDHMTANPICATIDTTVSKALDIMAQNNFHRLPIVDKDGKLIGLATAGNIEENSNTQTTSLSIYELNYLLSRTTVGDIMIKDVVSTTADTLLDEAAQLMMKNHISVLPVLDEEKKVVGIITEMDIFGALVELTGSLIDGTHFLIGVQEDTYGVIAEIAQCFTDHNVNINNFTVFRGSRGVELYTVVRSHCPEMVEQIEGLGKGYKVTIVKD